MLKVRKGDIVQVIKGKDTGKKGKVLNIITESKRALVEAINLVKKHKKQTRQDQQGGIVSIEAPISVSNLMLVCKSCQRPVRVGFSILKDNTKVRICKSCKEAI
ncbi:MAG: 50S ribosomal protein L24 [Candidatus Omnitrophota bacterium]|mgnify:FL=1